MTIFERLWETISMFLSHLVGQESPALVSWAKQFATDEGKVILTDTAQYGVALFTNEMTMAQALEKVKADLIAKAREDLALLEDLIMDALRTHKNAAEAANVA